MKRLSYLIGACAGLFMLPLSAQEQAHALVSPAVQHDTLPSLRDVVPDPDAYLHFHYRREHELPLPYFPAGQTDAAVQDANAPTRQAPSPISDGAGLGFGFTGPQGSFTVRWHPPDTVGAIGSTQFLQDVNDGIAVFDKATKNVIYGPVPANIFWSGFGGPCEANNDGDPVVVYDKAADRWVVSQFSVASTPYFECVAVSQTNDATGAWNRYAFSYGSVFPDYPKMGVWPDGYYTTFNMFNGNAFAGSQLCAYNRAAMLAGQPATQQCFQLSTSFGGVLPADLDGSTPPPAGAPNYMLNFGTNSLNLWKFHADWTTPANTTLTGPTSIPVAAFSPGCKGGACIPQSGTGQNLDSLGDRLMFRLAYRNFGDHEALVVNHAVKVGANKDPYTGIRWYEIRSPGATPVVFQQSTFAPDAKYRWMGSIAMDRLGDIALGYSVSSSTTFPSIAYTGRLAGDALNTLQSEATLVAGTAAQTGINRWGDYSALTIDPVDDCTFWYTNEYIGPDATGNKWNTRIGSFMFPGCNASGPAATMSFIAQPASGANIAAGAPIAFTVHVVDASNHPVAGDSITLAVASGPGALIGTTTATTNGGGNASFSVSINVAGSYTLQASDTTTAITPATSNAFNIVPGAAATIAFTQQPVDATAGTANPGASAAGIVVSVTDGSSNPVAGASVSLVVNSGPGTLTVTSSQTTDAGGNATFGDAVLTVAGTYTLTAADGALSVNSNSFAISPAAPSLVFTIDTTSDVTRGDTLYTIAVTKQDTYGNVYASDPDQIDFSVPSCGGYTIGTVALSGGTAALAGGTQRLYTPGSLQVAANDAAATLSALSTAFNVSDPTNAFVFADGFDGCRP